MRGLAGLGLPTEFDERVYVALMSITADRGFTDRRVPFSVYQVLRIIGVGTGKKGYRMVEESLDRLVGVTFKSEGAFWDEERQERVHSTKAFHLVDEYWLRYKEQDHQVRETRRVPAYIVWSEQIWRSITSHYVKNLDTGTFFSLELPTARRLYRFLDKQMRYRDTYEIDIFTLAGRLGMSRYDKPSHVKRKLQPAFEALIESGFLESAEVCKVQGYTRVRFQRTESPHALNEPPEELSGGSLVDQLCAYGVQRAKAQDLVAEHPEARIMEKLDLLAWKLDEHTRPAGRPIRDPAGWLVRAIEQNYRPPQGFQTRAEREAEHQRLAQEQEKALEAMKRRQEEGDDPLGAASGAGTGAPVEEHGTADRESDLWQQVLEAAEAEFGTHFRKSWLANTQLQTVENGTVTVTVPSPYTRDFLEGRAGDALGQILDSIQGEALTLRFVTVPRADPPAEGEDR